MKDPANLHLQPSEVAEGNSGGRRVGEPPSDPISAFNSPLSAFPCPPSSPPLNILFSGLDWFPAGSAGGLDRYFYEMLQVFGSKGHAGQAMVSSCGSSALGNIAVRSLAEKGASFRRRWHGASRVADEVFAMQNIDLVNAHFALYAFPWLRDIPKNVPLVVNFHGPWANEMRTQSPTLKKRLFSLLARRIELAVYRRADRIITLSEAFRDLLHRQYGIPLSRISVVPGGVDARRYMAAPSRPEARVKLGWSADRPIFLAVRRLAKRMGLEMLIEAVQMVRVRHPEVLLFIGGKGDEHASLQRLIETHGLEDNVRLLGFIPDEELPLAYAAADCSVVPTVALEGFGLIIIESLASGTPVLGTPVGAIPEILKGLDENLIFPAVNAEALADRMNPVLDRNIILPARETCRAYAQQYSWPVVMPKILEIFHQVIANKQKLPTSNL